MKAKVVLILLSWTVMQPLIVGSHTSCNTSNSMLCELQLYSPKPLPSCLFKRADCEACLKVHPMENDSKWCWEQLRRSQRPERNGNPFPMGTAQGGFRRVLPALFMFLFSSPPLPFFLLFKVNTNWLLKASLALWSGGAYLICHLKGRCSGLACVCLFCLLAVSLSGV